MPYNYQHKYFICEYPHFLAVLEELILNIMTASPSQNKGFKDVPVEVTAPRSFLHTKEGSHEELLPLMSLFGLCGVRHHIGVNQVYG